MHSRRYKKASSRIAQREKVRKMAALILKIGLPAVFLGGLLLVLRADFLQIKNFEISGDEAGLENDMKSLAAGFASGTRFFVLPKSNILLLDKDELAAALLSNFGRIEEADINKNFLGKSVKISVKERPSDFLWCSPANECFFMDKSGLVFERAPLDGGLIVFRGILEGDPIMKNFASPERMQNYLALINAFKEAGMDVSSIIIESSDKGVAATRAGDVFFDPEDQDLALVAQNVILLIRDARAKNSSARFDYIDARFGNKLFYKLK